MKTAGLITDTATNNNTIEGLSRRQFLISASVVAGGMALGISACSNSPEPQAAAAVNPVKPVPWGPDAAHQDELSAWIHITPDDRVLLRVPTPEIGTGSMTQVAMNITEELGCDWAKVKVENGSVHRDYLEGRIYTSGFLPFFGGHGTDPDRMKRALQLGASARERLKMAAAKRWDVPVADITAANSVVSHAASGRQLSYGEVAAEAASIALEVEPTLKDRSEWTFLGKASPAKLHIPEIVKGDAVFGLDVKVPGMVHAALKQSPVHGGRLKSHKPEAVMGMPGVRAVVVVDPSKTVGTQHEHQSTWGFDNTLTQSGVAVIADHYWQAKMALDALPVTWETSGAEVWESSAEMFSAARSLLARKGTVLRSSGDVGSSTSGTAVEARYETPYCENAALEPLNGTALVTDNSLEMWCPTQDTLQAYWIAIHETGFDPQDVKLHQTYVGGGFGRRSIGDDVRMIVAVAKEYPGVPVKTIWSREECFAQGRYRTPMTTRFKAVLREDGYPQSIDSKVVYIGTAPLYQLQLGYDDMPYFTSGIIPNVLMQSDKLPVNVLNGAYRGPCFNSHAFNVECFIDECAVTAGIDPFEYRLQLMSKWDKAWSDCLRVAADKAGWGQSLPADEGMGIAITNWPKGAMHDAGTTVCAVARVKVTQQGVLTVKQVDVAFDCGSVANEDAVRAQFEGGTLFGVNMTLHESLAIENGVTAETNFHQYPLMKMGDDLPQVNVHFDALSGHERFDIIGEAPVGPVGPAIANAVYQVTGKRIRSTPLLQHDLSWG